MNLNQENRKIVKAINQNHRQVHSNIIPKKLPYNSISVFQSFIGVNSKQDNQDAPYFQPSLNIGLVKDAQSKKRSSVSSQYFSVVQSSNEQINDNKIQCKIFGYGMKENQVEKNLKSPEINNQQNNELSKCQDDQLPFTPTSKRVPISFSEGISKHSLTNTKNNSDQNVQIQEHSGRFTTPNTKFNSLHIEREASTPIIKERFLPNDQKYKDFSSLQVYQMSNQLERTNKDGVFLPQLDNSKSQIKVQKYFSFKIKIFVYSIPMQIPLIERIG